jgi:hypothetical protein
MNIPASISINNEDLFEAIESDVRDAVNIAIEEGDYCDRGDVEQCISDADFCDSDEVTDMIEGELNDYLLASDFEDTFNSMFRDNTQALIRDIEDEANLATAEYDQLFANYNVMADMIEGMRTDEAFMTNEIKILRRSVTVLLEQREARIGMRIKRAVHNVKGTVGRKVRKIISKIQRKSH